MTICIGVISDHTKKVIVTSDRMITTGDLTTTFEHDVRKLTKVSGNCVALTAGPALVHTELFRNVKEEIHEGATPPISNILDIVKKEYLRIRQEKVEERYFKVRNFDLEWFREHQRTLSPEIAIRLDKRLETFEFNLSILIAGVDTYGAHLYLVYPPCSSECFESLGYLSIGSGERHADSVFISHKYSPSFPFKNALYITYEAKKKSEIAVGVGKHTDMAFIDKNGITDIDQKIIDKLDQIYNMKLQTIKLKDKETQKLIDELPIGGNDNENKNKN